MTSNISFHRFAIVIVDGPNLNGFTIVLSVCMVYVKTALLSEIKIKDFCCITIAKRYVSFGSGIFEKVRLAQNYPSRIKHFSLDGILVIGSISMIVLI